MKKKPILLVILFGLILACGNDDGPQGSGPATQNRPPASFGLLEVTDNETEVDVLPTLSWEQATDPDGDTVTYDLYVDTAEDPTVKIVSSLTTTSFQVTERLHLLADYHWKVTARDGKGGETESTVRSFVTRNLNIPEGPITTNAAFSGRRSHTVTAFQERLWVIGRGVPQKNDVWSSGDGKKWERENDSADFSPRQGHTTTVFRDTLWVIGGFTGIGEVNDIWNSGDGREWKKVLPKGITIFSPRSEHTTTFFDNKLWIIGGSTANGPANDIWNSSNGRDWERVVTDGNTFLKRTSHTTVVLDNKLWVIGGFSVALKNDVWYSENGKNWTEATPTAAFSPRSDHISVGFDDKLWVIGGDDGAGDYKNDIWYSTDGKDWMAIAPGPSFLGRRDHASTVFDDKIWIVAGRGEDDYENDVWVFD